MEKGLEVFGNPIMDTDEEINDLFTQRRWHDSSANPAISDNLGMLDRDARELEVTLYPHRPDGTVRELTLTIDQSSSVQQGRPGSGTQAQQTGGTIWKASIPFASWLASQDNLLWRSGILARTSTVLELGSGVGGIVALALHPWVAEYIATDQAYAMKLLEKNLQENKEVSFRQLHSLPANRSSGIPARVAQLSTAQFDWQEDDIASFCITKGWPDGPDIILTCDCIYNDVLITPLVSVMAEACKCCAGTQNECDSSRRGNNPTVCVIVQQIRSDEVMEKWLEAMESHGFMVWRVRDQVMMASMREDGEFVVHVAAMRTPVA